MMIIAKERIKHDGEVYEADDEIENIEEEDAQRLVNLGVAFFMQEKHEVQEDEEVNIVDIEEELESIDYGDLKELAKKVGLDFAGNISKKNLIALVIKEEKSEEVLNSTEVEIDA